MRHIWRFAYFLIMLSFCFLLMNAATQFTLQCAAFIIMLNVVVDILLWYIED